MTFRRLLRATVLSSAASATALALVVVLDASALGRGDRDALVAVAVSGAWWAAAGAVGVVVGARSAASPSIARLMADARPAREHPPPRPVRTLVGRLWPLLAATTLALVVGAWLPQVAGVAAGFALLAALAWRRQEAAVRAVEERDGVEFVVRPDGPLAPMRLVRLPAMRRERRDGRATTGAS